MKALLSDDRGQGLIEYGLILGLIALVAVGALLMVGGNVNSSLRDPLDGSTSHSLNPFPQPQPLANASP